MKNTFFLLLLVVFSCEKNNTVPYNPSDTYTDANQRQTGGIKTPNQISIWFENQTGFDKYMNQYNNPDYFLYFSNANINNPAYGDLEEGLDYVLGTMNGEILQREYGFTFVVKVKGGLAGAVYLYPEENVQDAASLGIIEDNIITTVTEWASENNVHMNTPQFSGPGVGNDKYMVITINL